MSSFSPRDQEDAPRRHRRRVLAGLCAIGVGAPVLWHLADGPQPPSGAPTPVRVDDLVPGRLRSVEWQGYTVWLLRRTSEEVAALAERESSLRDPNSEMSLQPEACRNRHRSLRPEILVAIGQCTHLGCPPVLRAGNGPFGEFLCPCHTSKFDLAGRVFSEGPALTNLTVPAYRFEDAATVMLGETA